jgi:hypothetical protein
MDYSEGVSPQQKGSRSLRNAMQHHMQDVMVYFAHKRKSGKVVSIGLLSNTVFKGKTQCITIRMPESSSIHIVTSSVNNQQQYHEKRVKRL